MTYYGLSRQTKHTYDIASILVIVKQEELDWRHFYAWLDQHSCSVTNPMACARATASLRLVTHSLA